MSLKILYTTFKTLGQGVIVGLPEADRNRDPFDIFREWFAIAGESRILLPEAMTLATSTSDGKPSARMVLFKGLDDRGFRFFTNYESLKGRQLDENPHAALVFHWAVLHRQVRIEGSVERLTKEESEAYFKSRPRGSRIGAWASRQSRRLEKRNDLEDAARALGDEYSGRDVPLPPFWGGFRVIPTQIEFWQGRADRLHDRIRFNRIESGWESERLYP
ncbi:MAG TPA: pyridoxamine 5'-phosphate oxidase [Rhodothermales bacterium]|nr:pyridoxamine 5'-phosphate oxidase [Rhodothermales bacterium]